MKQSDVFFARKEQSEFIKKVYELAPAPVREFFAQEERLLSNALAGCFRVLEIGCGYGRAVSAVHPQTQDALVKRH
jgi:tRNA G46 methylase TrmB